MACMALAMEKCLPEELKLFVISQLSLTEKLLIPP